MTPLGASVAKMIDKRQYVGFCMVLIEFASQFHRL